MIETVDIHSHLLNPNVKFDRIFDKISITLFGKKLGIIDKKLFLENPYEEYKKLFIRNIDESEFVKASVLFSVDSKYDNRGNVIDSDKTVCSSNDALYDFAKNHPKHLIPFFSINPLRPDALDKIDEYYEKGFKGAKFLQNYWDINSNDKKFIPYYEKLKKYNLPIIIHTGSEFTIQSNKNYETLKMLRLPVESGVNVISAHMGLGVLKGWQFWNNFSTEPFHFDKQYFKLLSLLEDYPNLYADVSAIITPMRARVLSHLPNEKRIQNKLLFGTDYPVPFTAWTTYNTSLKSKIQLENIKNPLDRYVLILLQYFDKDAPIFTNYKKILL